MGFRDYHNPKLKFEIALGDCSIGSSVTGAEIVAPIICIGGDSSHQPRIFNHTRTTIKGVFVGSTFQLHFLLALLYYVCQLDCDLIVFSYSNVLWESHGENITRLSGDLRGDTTVPFAIKGYCII